MHNKTSVLPSEGPRPLGLAAEDLLALRVVPRPRRLDQLLVATHRPAQRHKIKSHWRCSTHHHKNSSIVFVLSLKSLPNPPLFLSRTEERPAAFHSCCSASCARTCSAPSLPSDGGDGARKAGLLTSTTMQPPPRPPSSGGEESLLYDDDLMPCRGSRRCLRFGISF